MKLELPDRIRSFLEEYGDGSYFMRKIFHFPDGDTVIISTKWAGRSERSKKELEKKIKEKFPAISTVIIEDSDQKNSITDLLSKSLESISGITLENIGIEIEKDEVQLEVVITLFQSRDKDEIEASIQRSVSDLLSAIRLKLSDLSIFFEKGSKIPKSVIIGEIIRLAPVDIETLLKSLKEYEKDYDVSKRSVQQILDDLRKAGFIIWISEKYIASENAIRFRSGIPSRKSLDIQRALNMKYQKW